MNIYFEPVNVNQWNIFENVSKIGHIEPFLAVKSMKKGDLVLFHVGSQNKKYKSGIYAYGIIVEAPYILKNSTEDYCNNKNTVNVRIDYISYSDAIISHKKTKEYTQQFRTAHKINESYYHEIFKVIDFQYMYDIETEKENNYTSKYCLMRRKLESVGFEFEKEQKSHRQNRKYNEFKFVNPLLINKFEIDGYSTRAQKFYLKALNDEVDSEIGFVVGSTSPLANLSVFPKPNSYDTYDNNPAWVNTDKNMAFDELLIAIEDYLEISNYFSDTIDETNDIYEGIKKQISINKYERSAVARSECIKYRGIKCTICGFDFEKVYGDIGKNFIHVHHIVPMHEIGAKYKIDYKEDLVPVCPNCHAMLHKKVNGKTLTIQELKEQIRNK